MLDGMADSKNNARIEVAPSWCRFPKPGRDFGAPHHGCMLVDVAYKKRPPTERRPAELQVDAQWQRSGDDLRGSISVRTTRPLALFGIVAVVALALVVVVWLG